MKPWGILSCDMLIKLVMNLRLFGWENHPQSRALERLLPSQWWCVGRSRWCSLAGGSSLWGLALRWDACTISRPLSSFVLAFEIGASCPGHHACRLRPWQAVFPWVNEISLLPKFPLLVLFYPSNRKITEKSLLGCVSEPHSWPICVYVWSTVHSHTLRFSLPALPSSSTQIRCS